MDYNVSSGVTSTGLFLLNGDVMNVLYDGTARITTVNIGGRMTVSEGGLADDTVVNSGGDMVVSTGGMANVTTVKLGGSLRVASGGIALAVTENGGYVSAGGEVTFVPCTFSGAALVGGSATLHSGTTAVSASVFSALMEVYSGGMDVGTVVDAAGKLTISSGGLTTSAVVFSDGALDVREGGVADAALANSGGIVRISSGGVATSSVVNALGLVQVQGGGKAIGTVLSSGGSMQVLTGGTVCGLRIADTAVVVMDAGTDLLFDLTDRTAGDPALVNDLSLIFGAPFFSITVPTAQTMGVYALAGGAAGFEGVVTIRNTAGASNSLTVGKTVTLGNRAYTLTLNPATSSLSLSVAEGISVLPDDLNGDGRADIVMTITESGHGAEGATGAWLIQSDQTPVWGDLSQRNAGWEIFGMGVTDAGKATDDVYVKSSDNVIGAWVTDDTGHVTGWETVGQFDADTQILGLGDFNGDGQTDLLLRNVNGAVGCYFTGGETTGWNYFQSLGDEWHLDAIGDLNGDGRSDVVLSHDAGFAGSWLTQGDGTVVWADLDTLGEGYSIVGCGDFNGDGVDDVLLQKGSYFGAWLVEGGSAKSWFGLGDLGDVTVEQISDFDGDGKDDLRIRTSAGDLGSQLVKGADTLEWHYYGSVGSEWSTTLASL